MGQTDRYLSTLARRLWPYISTYVRKMLGDNSVGGTSGGNNTSITSPIWVPSSGGLNYTPAPDEPIWMFRYGGTNGWELQDATYGKLWGWFVMPDGAGTATVYSCMEGGGDNGNLYIGTTASYGAKSENWATVGSSVTGWEAVAFNDSVISYYKYGIQSLSLSGVAANDVVELGFTRDATHASDTYSSDITFYGWYVEIS